MKPLFVLIGAFLVTLLVLRVVRKKWDYVAAGRIALSVMLVFTAMGHFMFTKGMEMMLPSSFPFKEGIIYATGILELLGAIGILIPRFRFLTGALLELFFLLVLPANIIAAMKQLNIEEGSYNGPGTEYLWFRIPLQFLFMGWVHWFILRKELRKKKKSIYKAPNRLRL